MLFLRIFIFSITSFITLFQLRVLVWLLRHDFTMKHCGWLWTGLINNLNNRKIFYRNGLLIYVRFLQSFDFFQIIFTIYTYRSNSHCSYSRLRIYYVQNNMYNSMIYVYTYIYTGCAINVWPIEFGHNYDIVRQIDLEYVSNEISSQWKLALLIIFRHGNMIKWLSCVSIINYSFI